MKIGFGLPNQVRNVRPETIPQFAVAAEEAGFSTLGTVGRYAYPGVSDTVTLAAAAGATKTIGLFSHVMLAPVWPGELLAKELAGIDGVSGHRLTLGIGYFNLGAEDEGRNNVRDYYSVLCEEMANGSAAGATCTPETIKDAVTAYEDLGADSSSSSRPPTTSTR
jgi:alkanesulfonate monooxygenase SsuD/methylene tetrahydromethanopterin reductase-like flavin-dependent oxidoreductase (luciferase family)